MRRVTTLCAAAAILAGGSAAAIAAQAPADAPPEPAPAPAVAAAPAGEVAAEAPARGTPRWAQARLRSNSGTYVGTATFRDRDGATEVRVDLRWIKPGFHGLHLHTVGKCELNSPDPADPGTRGAYLSAGGHWRGSGGADHPDHAGDMPSVLATKNTRVQATFVTDRFSVAELFDRDGTAIILHQGRDNFANIPTRYSADGPDAETRRTGDAGSRGACGVIRR